MEGHWVLRSDLLKETLDQIIQFFEEEFEDWNYIPHNEIIGCQLSKQKLTLEWLQPEKK